MIPSDYFQKHFQSLYPNKQWRWTSKPRYNINKPISQCNSIPFHIQTTNSTDESSSPLIQNIPTEVVRELNGEKLLDRTTFFTEFSTNAYLEDFYTKVDDPAMQMVLTFLPNIVARLGKVDKMLDFGAGPTIHVAACFREIANEVRRWEISSYTLDICSRSIWPIICHKTAMSCVDGWTTRANSTGLSRWEWFWRERDRVGISCQRWNQRLGIR